MVWKSENTKEFSTFKFNGHLVNNGFFQELIKEENEKKSDLEIKKLSKRIGLLITIVYIVLTIISILKGFYFICNLNIISIFVNFLSFILFSIEFNNKKFNKILFGIFIFYNYAMLIGFLTFICKDFFEFFFNENSKINEWYLILLDINCVILNVILFLYDSGKILGIILNMFLISFVAMFYKDNLEYKMLIYVFRIFLYIFVSIYNRSKLNAFNDLEIKFKFFLENLIENEKKLLKALKIKKIVLLNNKIIENSFYNKLETNTNEVLKINNNKNNHENNNLENTHNKFTMTDKNDYFLKILEDENKGQLFLENFINIKSLNSDNRNSEEFSLSQIILKISKSQSDEYGNQKNSQSENILLNKNSLKKKSINFDKRYSLSVSKSNNILKADEDKNLFNFHKRFFSERDNHTNKKNKNLLSLIEKDNKPSNSNLLDVFNKVFKDKRNEKKMSINSKRLIDRSKTNMNLKSNKTCNSLKINEIVNDCSLKANKNSNNFNLNILYKNDKILKEIKKLDSSKINKNDKITFDNKVNNKKIQTIPLQNLSKTNDYNNPNKNETFSFLLEESKCDLKISKNSSYTSVNFENNFNNLSDIIKVNETNNFILRENDTNKIKIIEIDNLKNRNNSYTNEDANKDVIDDGSQVQNQKINCTKFSDKESKIDDKIDEEMKMKHVIKNTKQNNINKFFKDLEFQTNINQQNNTLKYHEENNIENNELMKKQNNKKSLEDLNFENKNKMTESIKIINKDFNNQISQSQNNQKITGEKKFNKNSQNFINLFALQNLSPLGFFINPLEFKTSYDKNKIQNPSKKTGNQELQIKLHDFDNNINEIEKKNNQNNNEKIIKQENNSIEKRGCNKRINLNKNLFDEYNSLYEVYVSSFQVDQNEYQSLYFREIDLKFISPFLKFSKKLNSSSKIEKEMKEGDKNDIKESSKNLIKKKLLEETEKEQNRFFSKLVHELKTPLNSIIGVTLNIIENYEEENQLENINLLGDLSKYTTFLINDITQTLNQKLIETYKINKVVIDLKSILEFSFNILKALLKCYDEKFLNVQPIFEFDENINNFIIHSDEIRLKQIILNFLSNSVKFTKKGYIRIDAKVSGKNYEFIEILIKDSGIGIESGKVNAFNELDEKVNSLNYANSSIFHSNLLMNNIKSKGSYKNSNSTITNIFNLEKYDLENSNDESSYIILKNKSGINDNNNNISFQPKKDVENKNLNNIGTNNEFGTGFGLIIAKRFAMRMGHKIELQSVYGESTLLSIKLFPSQKLQNLNDNSENLSTKRIDHIETLSFRKIKNFLNFSNHNDSNFNENTSNENKNMSFKEFSHEQNTFGEKNEMKFSNDSSQRRKEDLFLNLSQSSKDYKNSIELKNTIRQNSKGNFEFIYKNYMNENNYNLASECEILDSDLTCKILNVRKLSKELTNIKSNRIFSQKSSLINSNKSLFNITNHPSPKDNHPNINKNNSDKIFYDDINSNAVNYQKVLFKNHLLNSNNTTSLKRTHSKPKNNHDFKDYKYLFGNSHKPIILLIDDQKFIRKSLANLINLILNDKKLIWDILEGGDGIDLLNYIIEDNKNNNVIKLIITDENMEFINGTKAIEIIRHLENENKIKKNNKIIITTSADENEDLFKYYSGIGANHNLTKPCNQENLLKIFEKLKIV